MKDKLEDNVYTSEFLNSLQSMDIEEMRKTLIDHAKQVKELNLDLTALNNTVPGGIFKCLYDESLTLLYMSEGFLNMVGYTKEEIQELFHNSLRPLIVPSDLETIMVEVEKQMEISNTKQIQYRLIHKDGHYINVLDKGQLTIDEQARKCFHCIVVDVTREKKVEEELKLSLERYQIIMAQTDDVVFEWDILKDTFIVSDNWEKRYRPRFWTEQQGLLSILKDERTSFHPDDIHVLIDCIQDLSKGIHYTEREVRVKNYREKYVWIRIRMTAQFNDNHRPIKVIGVIIDIDQEKRHSLSLRKKAEQDALTGLYNKVTTQELIVDLIKDEPFTTRAFIIIDIDDFKKINDTMGHLYGDAVLNELSQVIQSSFAGNDIIGRIGGDEFMVFICDALNVKEIELEVSNMMMQLQQLRVTKEKKHKISCSVGIAMYPSDGNDFNALYQNADYALYQAKMQGKNQYSFYNEKKMHDYLMKQTQPYTTTINEKIDSATNNSLMDGAFEKYVFEILYHTENIESAMSMILEIIGTRFDVSRVYVFENSDDDSYCNNTFEWCNVGVEPQIQELQHITYEQLGGNYLENFNEERIFYCADIAMLPEEQYAVLEPQGIKSMLQSVITENGEFKGYVGFDECRKNRYWTKDQIDVLIFIAEIISTFLLKRRADEKLRMQNNNLLSMLNNQSSFIYVVEPETMKLLFLNEATRNVAPATALGTCCYKAFMNRDKPCHNCPAKSINKQQPNNTIEFYNEVLDIYSDVDAAYIKWQHKDAILLSCHDVTKYKKL